MAQRCEKRWWMAAGLLSLMGYAALAGPWTALPPLAGSAAIAQPEPAEPPVAIPIEALPEAPADGQPAAGQDAQTDGSTSVSSDNWFNEVTYPLIALGVGIAIVLGMIIGLKMNAFVALITAAMVVSLMAGGDLGDKIKRVAEAFGGAAGGIGIVIGMAAIIGKCMLDSGAADRIVRAFLRPLGEKRAPMALMGSGFVLAVPVFFDTVFYLLVPLARSLHRKTGKQYLKYILAIGAGGAITHTLVPPTPGPLLMAGNLGIDVGLMMMIGAAVALPAAVVGLIFSDIADRIMKTPMRSIANQPEPEPLPDDQLPSLIMSLLPVVLPVILISTSTILNAWADAEQAALIRVEDVRDWPAWRAELRRQSQLAGDNPGKLVLEHAEMAEARDLLLSSQPLSDALSDDEKQCVVDALRRLQADKEFYREASFEGIPLSDAAEQLVASDKTRMNLSRVQRMNRALLESAYGGLLEEHVWDTTRRQYAEYSNVFGNANLALLISAAIAMWTLVKQRSLTRSQLAEAVETSLMSGGVIILITAGGGAFGKMLTAADVGPAVETLFRVMFAGKSSGLAFLLLGFLVACVLKIAQGSSTVAMIVGSGMLAAIVAEVELDFNAVYLATAIGGGSLVGSWMNDSGFWIFAKMGGLTEVEALKSWTVMLSLLGLISLAITLAMAYFLPLV